VTGFEPTTSGLLDQRRSRSNNDSGYLLCFVKKQKACWICWLNGLDPMIQNSDWVSVHLVRLSRDWVKMQHRTGLFPGDQGISNQIKHAKNPMGEAANQAVTENRIFDRGWSRIRFSLRIWLILEIFYLRSRRHPYLHPPVLRHIAATTTLFGPQHK